MADFNKYFEELLRHEGGYVDNSNDRGGATNLGVTIGVWERYGYDKDGDGDIDKEDIKLLSKEDARMIAKKLYWDKVWGDYIGNQSIAEFLFDWAYNSGPATAIKKLQNILNVKPDGVLGKNTLQALNCMDQKELFDKLFQSRKDFFHAIVKSRPANKVFLKGWMNRLNSFKYKDN